jgi:catechol 2,3-dioxygenase-like lactoylglutathione lyase family enzyme
MPELGHVVFYVRDLQRSLAFHRDGVGLRCVGELFGGRAAALTGGRTHHELLLIEAGEAQGPCVVGASVFITWDGRWVIHSMNYGRSRHGSKS